MSEVAAHTTGIPHRRSGLQIALVADGDPSDPHTNSGVAYGMLQALQANPSIAKVVAIDGRFRGLLKPVMALATFRTSRTAWRGQYWKGRLAVAVRSRAVERKLQLNDVDAVVLLRNVYRPLSTPYVVFIDTTAALTQTEWPPWSLSRRTYKWRMRADRRQFHEALHVFTAGQYVADHVVRHYGVPSRRVSAIGGGVNYDVAQLPPWAPPPEPRILFVGHDFLRKGGDVLIEAFKTVRQHFPTAQLVLVGRGTKETEAVEGVNVLGAVNDRSQLSSLYQGATVFCVPSRFEPYGLVLQEALAHGVPCVGARVGAIPEILQNGRLGVLVEPGDSEELARALVKLLGDVHRQRRQSELGRAEVSAHGTWDVVAVRLVAGLLTALDDADRLH